FAAARKIAEAHDLPIKPDSAEEAGIGDVIVADVVNLEAAGTGIAQQHVGCVRAEEAAESRELPLGTDLTQRIGRQDGIGANVVNLIIATAITQNHVCRRGSRRRRIQYNDSRRDGCTKSI